MSRVNGMRLIAKSFEEAQAMAKALKGSRLVPRAMRGEGEEANILSMIMWGSELGFGPIASLQYIELIQDKPCLTIHALRGLAQSHPDYEYMMEAPIPEESGDAPSYGTMVDLMMQGTSLKDPAKLAEWVTKNGSRGMQTTIKRRNHEPYVVKFSIADAVRAGLWGKTGRDGRPTAWITHPANMLAHRATGKAIRDRFADALGGLGGVVYEDGIDLPVETTAIESNSPVPVVLEKGESPTAQLAHLLKEKVAAIQDPSTPLERQTTDIFDDEL